VLDDRGRQGEQVALPGRAEAMKRLRTVSIARASRAGWEAITRATPAPRARNEIVRLESRWGPASGRKQMSSATSAGSCSVSQVGWVARTITYSIDDRSTEGAL